MPMGMHSYVVEADNQQSNEAQLELCIGTADARLGTDGGACAYMGGMTTSPSFPFFFPSFLISLFFFPFLFYVYHL